VYTFLKSRHSASAEEQNPVTNTAGDESSEDEEIISQFVLDIDKNQLPAGAAAAGGDASKGDMLLSGGATGETGETGASDAAPAVKLNEDGTRVKRRKCNDLSAYMKWAIVARYYEESNRKSDRLYHGSLDILCKEFSVSKRTIQRIVGEYKTQIDQGIKVPDMTNKKIGRMLEPKFAQEISDNIKKLKNKAKGGKLTVRGLADAYEAEFGTKVSYMTLYRYDKRTSAKSQKPIKYAKSGGALGASSSSSSSSSSSANATAAAAEYAAAFAEANDVAAAQAAHQAAIAAQSAGVYPGMGGLPPHAGHYGVPPPASAAHAFAPAGTSAMAAQHVGPQGMIMPLGVQIPYGHAMTMGLPAGMTPHAAAAAAAAHQQQMQLQQQMHAQVQAQQQQQAAQQQQQQQQQGGSAALPYQQHP